MRRYITTVVLIVSLLLLNPASLHGNTTLQNSEVQHKISMTGGIVMFGSLKSFTPQNVVIINAKDGKEYVLPAAIIEKIEKIDSNHNVSQKTSETPDSPQSAIISETTDSLFDAIETDSIAADNSSEPDGITVSKDTVVPVISSPEEKEEPPEVSIYTDSPEIFSFFNFGKGFKVGLGCSYIYYNEKIYADEIINQFTQYSSGIEPAIILGKPKSTEYGYLPSLNASFMKVFPRARIFIQPKLSLLYGYKNTYDGSSQAQLIQDEAGNSVGLKFVPIKDTKTNIFFDAAFESGFCSTIKTYNIAIYYGLNYRHWYRGIDKIDVPDDNGNIFTVVSSETYTCLSIPVGINFHAQLPAKCGIGINAAVNFMILGKMQISTDIKDEYGNKPNFALKYDKVRLGNKAQYKFELYFEKWLTNRMSLTLAPYAQLYSFGKSNSGVSYYVEDGAEYETGTFYEPESSTFMGGLNLYAGFAFKPFSLR